jgi:hypothetical protein
MRRLSTIAALSAGLLLPLPLHAQFRAAPDSPAFGSARMLGGFVSPRPMRGPIRTGPVGPGPSRPGPSRPGPIGPRPFRPAPFGGRWGRSAPQSFSQPQFTFIAPLFFPYLGYPPSPADYEPAQQPAEESAAPETAPDNSLANQVAALTDEVEELRQQQESPESSAEPEAEPQPAVEERSVPAVFVYRDGQQFEARNYAVLGQTLWIYEDDVTRKIPLARLDLDQTRKLNDERGIDFSEMR